MCSSCLHVRSWTQLLPGRGLIVVVVFFPAVLHQVEQGWFSLELSVEQENLSLWISVFRTDRTLLPCSFPALLWSGSRPSDVPARQCLKHPPVSGAFAVDAKSYNATPNLYSQSSRGAWQCDRCLCAWGWEWREGFLLAELSCCACKRCFEAETHLCILNAC